MRTLSARILLGFAALALAFGAITAQVVVNMAAVEDDIHTIRLGYVPLIPASKNLDRLQEDLKTYLDVDFGKEVNPYRAKFALRTNRERRDASLKALQLNAAKLVTDHITVEPSVLPRIDKLGTAIDGLNTSYDQLLASLKGTDQIDTEAAALPLRATKDGEHAVFRQTTDLARKLDSIINDRTTALENREHKVRYMTIGLGFVSLLIALMISIWVVITLRPLRRLRDAARRVAAGDYANRIPEKGPAEVADLARELNSMARAVEERERELVRSERLAAVGKLAAMITHEVRNPLSAIGLNAELLDDELSDNAEGRALCKAIHHEVDRLTAITEEYLAFGRLPKPKINSEHVNKMIEALAAFVREELAAKQVELAVELGEHDPIALADASQLRQCLVNLVRNASEAVASKGGGKVTLRTRKAGDRVVIEVEDTGVGIAPEVLPRLFDTFFSTKEGGSGLGLALTQQIVKDHGGDLAVASTVGRGTTFTVSIPRG